MNRKITAVTSLLIVLLIVLTSLSVNSMRIGNHTSIVEKDAVKDSGALYKFVGGETIYVDDNNTEGPWEGTMEYPYQHIQSGIDHAAVNDTVYVFNGTYYESLIINKSIRLLGENDEKTIIDGMYSDIVVHIISDEVTLENLTVRNSGGYNDNAGIKSNSNTSIIKNCIIYRAKTGISVDNAVFSRINNCTIFSNGEGILLKSSNNTVIEGCSLGHNAIGLHLENSFDNLIKYCYLHTNGLACLFNDSSDVNIVHCNISDNSDNHGGIFITGCSNITVSNCVIRHNGMGVNTADSHLISIEECTIHLNTHFAILMKQSSYDITVSGCEITDNLRFGLYVIEDSMCRITRNNIYGNTLHGLYVKGARCNARNNWWGSPWGPSYTELRKGSRINWRPRGIRFIPWILRPLESVGPSWKSNEEYMSEGITVDFTKQVNLSGNDTDDDGCPDWWEEEWEEYDPNVWEDHANLDPDNDGLNNIEECFTYQWGSDPFHKDLFIEFDWVEKKNPCNPSNKPPDCLIDSLITLFEAHNISLHVDTGNLGGGEEIPYRSHFSFADLRDLYWDYFLHNDLNNPRKGVFHYGIVCDYGPDLNFPFVGWDHFDSFLISAQWLKEEMPYYSRDRLIAGGAVHQLGSTLGLLADVHGGNDNLGAVIPFTIQWLKYRNYKSCMNYYYKYRTLSYSDGSHGRGDFDDWGNLDFSFFKNSHFEWPKE